MEYENAMIEGVDIFVEDHGILTAMVRLRFGGSSGQSFGGYAHDQWDDSKKSRVPTVSLCVFVKGVMDAVGSDAWEKLAGKPCRIGRLQKYGPIETIGHLFEDKWFNPKSAFEEIKNG